MLKNQRFSKNIRVISQPSLLKGIPKLAWFVDICICLIIFNICNSIGVLGIITLLICVIVFGIIYGVMAVLSANDPDFLEILFIKYTQFPKTLNIDFEGNRYVA